MTDRPVMSDEVPDLPPQIVSALTLIKATKTSLHVPENLAIYEKAVARVNAKVRKLNAGNRYERSLAQLIDAMLIGSMAQPRSPNGTGGT